MPRPRNKLYVCTDCRVPFRAKAVTPCPNCGGTHVERALGKLDPSPEEEAPAPAIPQAPPAPTFAAAKPPAPGGAITPAALLAARAKLQKVVRQAKPLPGGAVSSIPLGVRVLANAVQNPMLPPVRLGRPFPKQGPMYYLATRTGRSLEFELRQIASGIENPAHGHFNTQYYNHSRELPTRNNPFDRVRAVYFEYGWVTQVPQARWYDWYTAGGAPAPNNVCNTLGNYIRQDGGVVNLERLIIADTGEVFYTPDHYLTFFRYTPLLKSWTQYLAPESRYGTQEPDWDASVYYA
jgi:hypothetical protein